MLHKVSKVRGFHLHATDGTIGHVDDFLFDETCAIRYFVVDTSHFWGHKWMLIASTAVQAIDAPNRAIYVSLTGDQIRHSPSIDTADIELIETLPSLVMM
jgi:hypothetical protein